MFAAACEPQRTAETPPGVDTAVPSAPSAAQAPSTPPSLPDLAQCPRTPQAASADQTALLKVKVRVDPAGHVTDITDDGSTPDHDFLACAERVLKQTTFPPCSACVSYDLELAVAVAPPPVATAPPESTEAPPPEQPPLGPIPDAGAPTDGERWL
jgi:hypothetical protein